MNHSHIEQIASAAIMAALLAGWLALIIRKKNDLGPASRLREARWFLDIFRQGGKNIRLAPWVLWIPVAAQLAGFAETRVGTFLYFRKNPELISYLPSAEVRRERFLRFLQSLHQTVPAEFLKAASVVGTSALSGVFFHMITLLLFTAFLIFLFSRKETMPFADVLTGKKLALLVGAAGVILIGFSVYLWLHGSEMQKLPIAFYLLTSLSSLILFSVAYAALLHGIVSASRGERESFSAAVSKGTAYFRPMLLFFLGMSLLTNIANLPLFMQLFRPAERSFGMTLFWGERAGSVLLAMLSFLPLLIIVQRLSLTDAFHEIVILWARNWRSMAMLLCISALLLLIPVLFSGRSYGFFPPRIADIVSLVVLILESGFGVLILSSMTVFLKEIEA